MKAITRMVLLLICPGRGGFRGDALFFRMKANPAAGQTATAEVSIEGVKRTFTVKTK